MTPFVNDPDFVLYVGDAVEVLKSLPDESVHMCVTSPPYWGLRDYGTGAWEGGEPDCDHHGPPKASDRSGLKNDGRPAERVGQNDYERAATTPFRDACGKCGATRVDRQLGLEATPDEYVAALVAVFREVWRVLRRDGTCWLNLGDSYASAWACDRRNVVGSGSLEHGKRDDRPNRLVGALKEKDLVGIPWRVAFALQADGWYLRSDIIWSKPNPMPESVTDRPTKAHEYLFLLTRSPRYFYDADAIREEHTSTRWGGRYHTQPENGKYTPESDIRIAAASKARADRPAFDHYPEGGRNARSVWEITTQPYPEAHFATFPEELPRRCILAGCPELVCGTCGKPRERLTETVRSPRPTAGPNRGGGSRSYIKEGLQSAGGTLDVPTEARVKTVGWSDCGHDDYRPGVVLDPFLGSGTTALVARKHGRRSIGIELSSEYARLAARRLGQQSLLAGVRP